MAGMYRPCGYTQAYASSTCPASDAKPSMLCWLQSLPGCQAGQLHPPSPLRHQSAEPPWTQQCPANNTQFYVQICTPDTHYNTHNTDTSNIPNYTSDATHIATSRCILTVRHKCTTGCVLLQVNHSIATCRNRTAEQEGPDHYQPSLVSEQVDQPLLFSQGFRNTSCNSATELLKICIPALEYRLELRNLHKSISHSSFGTKLQPEHVDTQSAANLDQSCCAVNSPNLSALFVAYVGDVAQDMH